MKNRKLVCVLVAMTIVGLSLSDALIGHGVKNNKNLNSIVLGTGSNSGTNSPSGKDAKMTSTVCTITVYDNDGKPIEYPGLLFVCFDGIFTCSISCIGDDDSE